MVLELSSFLPFRIFRLSISKHFLRRFLLVELVLFEIRHVRDGRPAIPIAEHKFAAEGR